MIHNIFFFLSVIQPPIHTEKPKCSFIVGHLAELQRVKMERFKKFLAEAPKTIYVDLKKTEEVQIEIKK